MALPLNQAITRLIENEEAFDLFVNGTDTQSYLTRDGTSVPTLRRFLKDLRAQVIGIAEGSADEQFADILLMLNNKASIGSKVVNNQDYVALPSDVQIVYSALTQTRTVELPNITDYPYGQELVVVDGSRSASANVNIFVKTKTGTGQTINDVTSMLIASPGQALKLRRASDVFWFVI